MVLGNGPNVHFLQGLTLEEIVLFLRMAPVVGIGGGTDTLLHNGQGCIGTVFQGYRQGLFLLAGERGQHPVCQIKIRMGLAAHTDFDPGKVLRAQFPDDRLDAVVSSRRTAGPDPKAAGFQRDIVKQDDDPLGRYPEIGTELQHRPAGKIHIGQGFQQIHLFPTVSGLAVKPLKLAFIHAAAQGFRQNVQAAKTDIMPGFGILGTGISQANDQPAIVTGH